MFFAHPPCLIFGRLIKSVLLLRRRCRQSSTAPTRLMTVYDENRDVWTTIRGHCKGLLSDNDYGKYHELCDRDFDFFNYDVEENRLREWKEFLDKCDPYGKDIGSNDYNGQVNLRDDIKNEAKIMRERVIAHDQIKAFTLFLEGKPAQTAAYREFLVRVVFTVLAYILLSW